MRPKSLLNMAFKFCNRILVLLVNSMMEVTWSMEVSCNTGGLGFNVHNAESNKVTIDTSTATQVCRSLHGHERCPREF